MPKLHLKCKTCGIVFESGISADRQSFETLTLVNNVHQCPKEHRNSYDKKDYFF